MHQDSRRGSPAITWVIRAFPWAAGIPIATILIVSGLTLQMYGQETTSSRSEFKVLPFEKHFFYIFDFDEGICTTVSYKTMHQSRNIPF